MTGEGMLANRSVLVTDGRIESIAPAGDMYPPNTVSRIDGSGHYLIPGLTDMHIHPLHSTELLEYVRHGVTSVLIMRGRPQFLEWRDSVQTGALVGPNIYTTGPTTDGFPPLGWKFVGVRTPNEAECVIDAQAREGYDALKIYTEYEEETFAAVNDGADRAGLSVIGHIPRQIGAARALELGQDMIAHGEEFYFADFRQADNQPDLSLMSSILGAVSASGAYVTPMLSSTPAIIQAVTQPKAWISEGGAEYAVPPSYHNYKPENNGYSNRPEPAAFVRRNEIMYRFLQDLTQAFHRAGVSLLAGTDAGVVGMPGRQVHVELTELVRAGLSTEDALRAATINAGRFASEHLNEDAFFGVVSEGARADLVMLSANPLKDLSHLRDIEGVVVAGRWYPTARLDSLAESAARVNRRLRDVVDEFDELAGSGRLEEAVDLARTAQQAAGGNPLFHESIVRRHAVIGFDEDPDGALEMLRFNAELYPDMHAMFTTLGQVYMETGQISAAKTAFEQSLELSPCNAVALEALEELQSD